MWVCETHEGDEGFSSFKVVTFILKIAFHADKLFDTHNRERRLGSRWGARDSKRGNIELVENFSWKKCSLNPKRLITVDFIENKFSFLCTSFF